MTRNSWSYRLAFRIPKGTLLQVALMVCFAIPAVAQTELVTNDEGRTWLYSREAMLLDKSMGSQLMNLSSVEANYIKILDFVDPEYPGVPSYVVFGDANHNGKVEMYRGIYVSENQAFTRVYEFDSDMSYTITDIPFYAVPWALGDIDGNGLSELVVQSGDPFPGPNGYLRIYESPDPNSFPSVLKQEFTLPNRKVVYHAVLVQRKMDFRGSVDCEHS